MLPTLGASHRVVAYDRRGFGATRYQPERFSQLEDLRAVLDGFDARSAILVGNSQGARIAVDFALTHPNRTQALVLVAPAISGAPPLQPRSRGELELERAIDLAEAALDLDRVNQLEARLWLDGPDSPEGRVSGDMRTVFLEMNGRALQAQSPGEERQPPPAFGRLQQLRKPVHIVVGALDRAGVRDRAGRVAARVTGARLNTMAHVAHLPSLERQDPLAREVLGFLSTASP